LPVGLVARRGHGNMSFMDLSKTHKDMIQVVNRKNVIGEGFKDTKGYDIGDIIGVEGKVFKTNQGEISVETARGSTFDQVLTNFA
jgi:lysyl-tRNA synthetase class 2